MSKKHRLIKFKKSLLALGIASSTLSLTSCGSTDNKEDVEKKQYDSHEHLIINNGDKCIIFRECDDLEIDFFVSPNAGCCSVEIINENGDTVFSGVSSSYSKFNINNEANEKFMLEYEDFLIEKGAKVYTLSKEK